MDKDLDLITDLMNGLADARVTLNDCLSALSNDHEPIRKEVADTLRQQIADTLKEIEATRLKVLKRIASQG